MKQISISGASVHNLKNISLTIPRDKLIVFTGVSGSGKSSLAFDTIYAEGQRRYMESLSAYARQFLDQLDKPTVDLIEGLSPAISIDQKSGSKNPRSIVGTVTEIYDYFRLLFSAIGTPHCPDCNCIIKQSSVQEMCQRISDFSNTAVLNILAPLVDNRKGEFQDLFSSLLEKGFSRIRVNNTIYRLDDLPKFNKQKAYTIQLLVDRLVNSSGNQSRLFQSVETACLESKGLVLVENETDHTSMLFSESLSCPTCSFSLPELSARLFSFNSPIGACNTCNGLGEFKDFDPDIIVKDHHTPLRLGLCKLVRLGNKRLFETITNALAQVGADLDMNYASLSPSQKNVLFYGKPELDTSRYSSQNTVLDDTIWLGIVPLLRQQFSAIYSDKKRFYYRYFMSSRHCSVCDGARLNPGASHVLVHGHDIQSFLNCQIRNLLPLIEALPFSGQELIIIKQVRKEILNRLSFLMNVGLGYLCLSRQSSSLSGGEFQRIRLATQIGSALTGVLYVLDEPSIGLHQRDNAQLIKTLKSLRNLGNTLIVVEHDDATIKEADYIVELGPGAGKKGGTIQFSGTQKAFQKSSCLTAEYIMGKRRIPVPKHRRKHSSKQFISLTGVSEHNLTNISVTFPLGQFICITGVSGSGKSTLIYDVLHKAILQKLQQSNDIPGKYGHIDGLDYIDKVIPIDQSPIGRTPRSNPVTYIGVFTAIRDLFCKTKAARIRGYKAGRFSFNVKGGRCEACEGDGVLKIEMHFLSDVYVSCDVCKGKRYNQETLDIHYKGHSIADVLDLTVNTACELFKAIPGIFHKLSMLQDVGLGYIHLGQSATTLSGGEAQRVKLAKELSRKSTGKTLYLLDEPTTGLHFDDIRCLLDVLNRLVDSGNTLIVIEHNLDVIKVADHIIDMGPEGGDEGGTVVAIGTPEAIAKHPISYTGQVLSKYLT